MSLARLEVEASSAVRRIEERLESDALSDEDRKALALLADDLRSLIDSLDAYRRRAIPSPFALLVLAAAVLGLGAFAGWASASDRSSDAGQAAELNATNLALADLSGANLDGFDLQAACLRGAVLVGASLEATDLTDTDLRAAQLGASSVAESHGTFIIDADTVLPADIDRATRTRTLQPGERTTCG